MKREDLPAAQLKRCSTCKADIVWTITDTGAKLPVEPDPAPNGNVRLTVAGQTVRSHVLPAKLAFGHTDLHLSHYVNCPQSDVHRRRPTRRKART